jgi:cell wall assembly regulator SMI1
MRSIQGELERAVAALGRFGFRLTLDPPPSADEVDAAQRITGIPFDQHLAEYFWLCNGSRGHLAAAVMTDELTPLNLPPLHECVSWWKQWLPYDARVQDDLGVPETCDPRIRPLLVNAKWFPLAEFNCWSTAIYFDVDPTADGVHGQAIAYQHDPDGMYWVGATWLEFLETSNELLERSGRDLLFIDGRPTFMAPPPIR